MKNTLEPPALLQQFLETRNRTEEICHPLATEDFVPQPITDVSPPKWHLAHTTWFFEQFVLVKFMEGYRVFHPDFAFLFNSYYNNMGQRVARENRGFLTRPTVDEVLAYREYVTRHIQNLLQQISHPEIEEILKIGINHEQQHQELLIYDIKYILGTQPTFPKYGPGFSPVSEKEPAKWLHFEEAVHQIGANQNGFSYDNERPRHKVLVPEFSISNKLVTNAEFLEFMNEGGYENFDLWHDEGWAFVQNLPQKAPLYWHLKNGNWYCYTLSGMRELNLQAPVQHLSFYEAAAFAEWAGLRLPTEFEWEVAAPHFKWGQLWEWTYSAYHPYPGFSKAEGALGEYNGKFMVNQMVLRGASVATAHQHSRITYRNFFHASARWIFSGLRLAKPYNK